MSPPLAKTSIGQLVGASVRSYRLDLGLSQDALATRLREAGLPWSRSTLAALENGGKAVDLGELLALSLALNRPPAHWFEPGRQVVVGPGVVLSSDFIIEALPSRERWEALRRADTRPRRGQLPLPTKASPPGLEGFEHLLGLLGEDDVLAAHTAAKGEAERHAARRLGAAPLAVALASISRWGRSLSEERDERLAAVVGRVQSRSSSSSALRGHITRILVDEISPIVQAGAEVQGPNGRPSKIPQEGSKATKKEVRRGSRTQEAEQELS